MKHTVRIIYRKPWFKTPVAYDFTGTEREIYHELALLHKDGFYFTYEVKA